MASHADRHTRDGQRTHVSPFIGLALIAAGCLRLPPRYTRPERVYTPTVPHLSVSGFNRLEYLETGHASSVLGGRGVAGVGVATSGEYRPTNDASWLRWYLEDTRCVRVVDEDHAGEIRIEGLAEGASIGGWWKAVGVLEILTLTPLLGMPLPDAAEGGAVARLYRSGELARTYHASRRLSYATTVYTFEGDRETAAVYTRLMALRDLADQIAADLCGADAVPGPAGGSPHPIRQR